MITRIVVNFSEIQTHMHRDWATMNDRELIEAAKGVLLKRRINPSRMFASIDDYAWCVVFVNSKA